MRFEDLLGRADTALLQDFLGANVVRLLGALRNDQVGSGELRKVLLGLKSPQQLLAERHARRALFELLRSDEAKNLSQELGVGPGGDVFATLGTLDFRPMSKRFHALLGFFQLPPPSESEDEPLPPSKSLLGGEYELFEHQRSVVHRVTALLAAEPHRAVIHMPTGSGKTRTAMSLICSHLRNAPASCALWLASSEELCEQAIQEFSVAWRSLGDRALPIFRAWGRHETPDDFPRDSFIVAGLAKFYSRAISSAPWLARLGDRTSLIVFDEAHQAIAPTYKHVVTALSARRDDCRVLGLTATPGRTWNNVAADEELAEFFGRQKVALEIPGYDNPVRYLIEKGYLAEPTFVQLAVGGPELTESENQQLREQLEIPDAVLERLAADVGRNLLIAHNVQKLATRHQRILVFCPTAENATELAVVLRAQKLEARSVTAKTETGERYETIKWFKQLDDEPRILTNYGVLTTGFDAPRTSAALIARPTTSLVLFSQMVGRAIRGPKAGGNAKAEVMTVVDTGLPGFGSVAEAFYNWEDVWHQEEQVTP